MPDWQAMSYNNASTVVITHEPAETHSLLLGYITWIFGFTGSHRFYYGKPLTGLLWLATGGLLLVGWVLDFFFIPSMQTEARQRYQCGPTDYTIAWLLFGFLGIFGAHRFYMRKWFTGIVYACTAGLFGVGIIYDLFTLNGQISEVNVADSLEYYDYQIVQPRGSRVAA